VFSLISNLAKGRNSLRISNCQLNPEISGENSLMANRLRDLHAVTTAAAFDAWSPLIQSVNHAGPAVGATIASTLCFSNVASMPSPRALHNSLPNLVKTPQYIAGLTG
jgi:hypothetical protein